MDIYAPQAQMIPSDVYLDVPDFSTILEDIAQGKLPTGTNRPFPMYSTPDLEEIHNQEVPWRNVDAVGFIHT